MPNISVSIKIIALFLLISVSCKPVKVIQQEPEEVVTEGIQQEVTKLIVHMPAEHVEEEIWVNEQLTELGTGVVGALSGMLTDPATGSDLQARYALSSLANYAARPGASLEKQTFERAVLEEIQKDYSNDIKTFLLKQLRRTASNNSVPILESYLVHEKLYNDALRVLLILDSPEAASSIRQALPQSEGARQTALVKALGELKDEQSAEMIEDIAGSDEWPVQRMALFALSEIGQPGVSSLFEDAISTHSGFRQSEVTSFYLSYAETLLADGYKTESDRATDYFLNGTYPPHVKSSALTIRFGIHGEFMTDELIEIAQTSDAILARTSLKLLNELEGSQITDRLIEALDASSEVNKLFVIEAMADRGDPAVIPVLENRTSQANSKIGSHALTALLQMRGEVEPERVINLLSDAGSDEEIRQVEELFYQLEPDEIVPFAAASLSELPDQSKPAAIRLVTKYRASEYSSVVKNEWDGSDNAIRQSILQYLERAGNSEDIGTIMEWVNEDMTADELGIATDTFVAIFNRSFKKDEKSQRYQRLYDQATRQQKRLLTYAVPWVDGIDYTGALSSSLESSDADVQMAAVDVLGTDNNSVLLPLIEKNITGVSVDDALALIANYVQITDQTEMPRHEKEDRVHTLFSELDENSLKIALIQETESVDELLALQIASDYLDYEENGIREQAIQIITDILSVYGMDEETLDAPKAFLAALDRESEKTIKTEILKKMSIQEVKEQGNEEKPFYGDLFNGENLDGWQVVGTEAAWGVESGLLYTDGEGSGWLSTDHQYEDFIIELEYRVPEGGNSGLFIRAPHGGNPAEDGLEIQILDDYADRYADLQPWQYTGSIYFEQAVSKRVTKTAGEWQSLKVRAEGPKIQVTVNGELVVNANLIHYMDNVPNHSGLLRRSGYVGLQNHGDRVDFRNISIQEIR